MVTVLIFIIILGLLVFVHEFGHFIVARRNGVGAEEFGFGFPPRILGIYKNRDGRWKIAWGSKEVKSDDTIYSINWVPLGGFVKITGEDGEEKANPRSFAGKKPFARVRILAAGVIMNLILAVALFSFSFYLGVPQIADEVTNGKTGAEKIQISDIGKGTPAETMGLRMGDQILGAIDSGGNSVSFSNVDQIQQYVAENKGSQITLDLKRGNEELKLSGVPRAESPQGEGPLGIGLVETVDVSYPWYQAIVEGFKYTFNLIIVFISFLGGLIWRLVAGQPAGLDSVSGPVGIAVLTGQVAKLGLNYLVRFAGMLSVNLAIINALPIPALDGGRILFILIEKIKGSPVSQRIEQRAHSVGFALLISLMVFVTFRDVMRFDIVEKVRNLF
ncbi:MAG: RIP metalloprotease RseP [Parcubacteria group bacterium]|jgi:regulator of sigma E protease